MRSPKPNLKNQKARTEKKSDSITYKEKIKARDTALKLVQPNKPFRYVTTKEAVKKSLKRDIHRIKY